MPNAVLHFRTCSEQLGAPEGADVALDYVEQLSGDKAHLQNILWLQRPCLRYFVVGVNLDNAMVDTARRMRVQRPQ